jgi:DNA topoisomerase I
MLSNYIISLYWIKKQFGGDKKIYWSTLTHNGVLFPPDYVPINIPIIYKEKKIVLNPEAEEAAIFYSKYIGTEYVNNKFNKNFWKDFKKLIDPKFGIEALEDINFDNIKTYLEKERGEKLDRTKEEKDRIKEKQTILEEKYTVAIIDGKEQPVGNFRIEPPGIFIGRGCHPMIGRIKKRVYPKDIILNLGKTAEVPDTCIKGQKWNQVINDNTVTWLASWKEDITGKTKYVRLSDKSDFKSESDKNKFDLARKLKKKLGDIRKVNEENLNNDVYKTKQLATALYFIENLSLRVGNEKGKDEADTVGVVSLRVEHIDLLGDNRIKLDFLGKDSVRYTKKFEVIPIIYTNISLFMQNKDKKTELFDQIYPSDINTYLQNFMPGLTTKVFRTMNASKLFQKELNKVTSKFESYSHDDKINLLLDEFNKANAKVAMLCNHQKNINKNFKDQVDKINQKLKDVKKKKIELEQKKAEYKEKGKDRKAIKERISKIEDKIKSIKSKKDLKLEMKNVSLGTSKVNYIDPRITIAFAKKQNIDINILLQEALQDKFSWALNVSTDFIF